MLLIQKAEFDWVFAPGKRPLVKKDRPMRLLEGDLDVLGDASEKPAQAWINGQRHAPQSTSERRQPAGSSSSPGSKRQNSISQVVLVEGIRIPKCRGMTSFLPSGQIVP
jgi:hypothetical protein